MRSNQKNNRSRGRGNNNNRNKNSNPLTRSYDSNGPDVRVRGNASTVAEKYMQLARDANSAGDSVAAENYLQHAEHYFRIVSTAQAQQLAQQQAQAARAEQQQQGQRQQENRGDKGGDSVQSGDATSADPASEGKGGAEIADQGQQKPQRSSRERRPRRRPIAEKSGVAEEAKTDIAPTSTTNDPANAPQPEVSELPAFVTADADSSAAE
ncbi:MAG: DUF4167 domain-containing protein [Devosiaceae bacterium]|nr:DUF4167 domain-containing protein [Devosiaceae bacterium]